MAIKIKKLVLNPSDVVNGFHLTQVQDNIDLAISRLSGSQFQNGTFKTVTLLTGIDNVIDHGLDRQIQGWIVVDKNGQADIWQSSSMNTWSKLQVILKSSANVTAKIYFF